MKSILFAKHRAVSICHVVNFEFKIYNMTHLRRLAGKITGKLGKA